MADRSRGAPVPIGPTSACRMAGRPARTSRSGRDDHDLAGRAGRPVDTLPSTSRRRLVRGRDPSTIVSACSARDASRIASAGSPSQIRKVACTPCSRALRTISIAPDSSRSRSWSTRRRPAGQMEVAWLDHAQDDQRAVLSRASLIASSGRPLDEPDWSTASRIRRLDGIRLASIRHSLRNGAPIPWAMRPEPSGRPAQPEGPDTHSATVTRVPLRERRRRAGVVDALDAATRAIAGLQSVDDVLQVIVDQVRPLVGARYAALGIVDADGVIERFITAGIAARPERGSARCRVATGSSA